VQRFVADEIWYGPPCAFIRLSMILLCEPMFLRLLFVLMGNNFGTSLISSSRTSLPTVCAASEKRTESASTDIHDLTIVTRWERFAKPNLHTFIDGFINPRRFLRDAHVSKKVGQVYDARPRYSCIEMASLAHDLSRATHRRTHHILVKFVFTNRKVESRFKWHRHSMRWLHRSCSQVQGKPRNNACA
jgi:hypothetical protein